MGFKWNKEDSLTYVRESEAIQFKRSCFLRECVRNMESESPKPVVFLDETWIFMNGSATHSWSKPAIVGGKVQRVMRRPAEGGRLVIVHAGTYNGFIPGADLIFASNLKTGQDYHGAMNSETFQKWVERQLIVGLRDVGPSIIVMDNASYHNKAAEEQPTTKWRKDQLMTWLRQNGVPVSDNANKNELQQLCKRNKSHLKRHIVDELLAREGHTVLRLPPYHSFFNAIELVWSVAKNYYNKTVASRPGHGLDRAKSVWHEAFSKVTPDIWKNEENHTEKIIMKYYNQEVRNAPEFQEFIVDLRDTDEEDDADHNDTEDNEEVLATPIESLPGTSRD
ncbi:uncharacterized protein [Periplaneta americana]|uniref:uncharacterized protein isoform X1 n=1 Tax=Periplaneta americana TaxID=6978 RepID=UPI0037E97559